MLEVRDKGVVDLKISNKEFSKRIEKLESFEIRYKTGALAKFATLVQSASEGAVTMPILKRIRKHKSKELGGDKDQRKQGKALRHTRDDVPVDGVLSK